MFSPRASNDWLQQHQQRRIEFVYPISFETRLIPSGHRWQKNGKISASLFEVFRKYSFLSFWFLFNYGKLFVVYFSNDEFNWRIKYLMIYLTKQIVQLPLGFVYFYFALFFARKPLSLLFRPCACRYLITNCAMKRKGKYSENILCSLLSSGEILNYRVKRLCWLNEMLFW